MICQRNKPALHVGRTLELTVERLVTGFVSVLVQCKFNQLIDNHIMRVVQYTQMGMIHQHVTIHTICVKLYCILSG